MAKIELTLSYTGGWQAYAVPPGFSQVHIDVRGAGTGTARGGRTQGTFMCNPGDTIWVLVAEGGKGPNGRQGGGRAFGGGGAGGDGHGNGDGGRGGAGATVIRRDGPHGAVLMVAGGAGGKSGDEGNGGVGGGDRAGDGERGNAGGGATTNASGGSLSTWGKGGSSNGGRAYGGGDAPGVPLAVGGVGGTVNRGNSHGGGGGGAGYYSGGGGQASAIQDNPGGAPTRRFPGGGGGGGSSWVHPSLVGAQSSGGAGSDGNAVVFLTFSGLGAVPKAPSIPSDIFINGVPEVSELATKSMGNIEIRGTISDQNIAQRVRLVVVFTEGPAAYAGQRFNGDWATLGPNEYGQLTEPAVARIQFRLMPTNTLYKAQVWAEDETGILSAPPPENPGGVGYSSISFWTNRPPLAPELHDPDDNTLIPAGTDVTFAWDYVDPDGGETQGGFGFKIRRSATPLEKAGPWSVVQEISALQTLLRPASTFKANVGYDWTVMTRDPEGLWGPMALPRSLFILGDTTPPLLTYPVGNQAVDVGNLRPFTWVYRDPNEGTTQVTADLRYRVVGTSDWITLFGELDPNTPGSRGSWLLTRADLAPGQHYEWQVATRSSSTLTSDWSDSEFFWAIQTPGSLAVPLLEQPSFGAPAGPLGYGNNRVFVYRRGGQIPVGEITNMESVEWTRRRDSMGTITVSVTNFDELLEQLLRDLATWAFELVVFREGTNGLERAAEGPITLIDDEYDTFRIEAKDVTAYLHRRVMRQGYADNYQIIGGVQTGLRTVVERAELSIINALCYDDPNLLGYLTAIKNEGDARQSRVVPDHSKYVLEDIDDMAANAGLDYVAVGRRIILWDTHRMIGRLPEMRTSDFLTPPKISEYGMQACNYFAVTDGSGAYGTATAGLDDQEQPLFYGWLEMLASAYGTNPDEVADSSALTAEALAALEETFSEQARRNIAHRWPAPKQVKVSQGTRLNPEVNLSINQLIPGVWIPVRAKSRILEISQWQKLDEVKVTQDSSGEKVTVSMSPAPNGGEDPDAAASAEEE